MLPTIGWLVVAVAAGAVTGAVIGHWSLVVAWLRRCLEDPVVSTPAAPPARTDQRARRLS